MCTVCRYYKYILQFINYITVHVFEENNNITTLHFVRGT